MDQTWLCVGVVSPRRAITRDFDTNNANTIMFDPDYNMMPPFFSTATNIVLIKTNLKFESRASAVSVAMSPCYLGGKYHSRLNPRSRNMHMPVFAGDWACEIELRQTSVICFPWRQRSWSCNVLKSWISDAHCPFQWKWQVLYNYDKSVLQQVGMFFDGNRLLDEGLAFVQVGVPSCADDMRLRSCTREFQMWLPRCKQIDLHWFQGCQMGF